MTHIGQKLALSPVSTLRLGQRCFQRFLTAALRLHGGGDIRAGHAHPAQAHINGRHRGHLHFRREMLVFIHGIRKAIAILVLQGLANIFRLQMLQPQLPVLRHHMALQGALQKAVNLAPSADERTVHVGRIKYRAGAMHQIDIRDSVRT